MSLEVSLVEFEAKHQGTTKTFDDQSFVCLHVFQCAFACFLSCLVLKLICQDPKTQMYIFRGLNSRYNSTQDPQWALEKDPNSRPQAARRPACSAKRWPVIQTMSHQLGEWMQTSGQQVYLASDRTTNPQMTGSSLVGVDGHLHTVYNLGQAWGVLGNSPKSFKQYGWFSWVYLGILRLLKILTLIQTLTPKPNPFPSQVFPKNLHERSKRNGARMMDFNGFLLQFTFVFFYKVLEFFM